MKVIGKETKKVSDLKPHPESLRIYGKDEPLDTSLLERIKERGILEPIVIEESGLITSGVQRWRCAKKLGMEEIEAMIVQYDNPLERKKDILDRNVKREKTFSQKMREAEAWEDIEKKEAEERKSRGGRGVQMNTPSGKVRDIVAKRIKMGSGTTYHRAKKVWTKAKNGSKYAKQQVEKLDKGETTISHAYSILTEKEPEQTKSTSKKTKAQKEKTGKRMYEGAKDFPSFFVGCNHDCKYCKTSFQKLMKLQPCERCKKYEPHLHEERFLKKPPKTKDDGFLFMCDCGDVAFTEPYEMSYIVGYCGAYQDRTFLIQSKDPRCFEGYPWTDNVTLGTTIETNKYKLIKEISDAPDPKKRVEDLLDLDHLKKTITVEPIMEFDLDVMVDWIEQVEPYKVWIGYDSHPDQNRLQEPTISETNKLISAVRNDLGIDVIEKKIRKAWSEE